MTVAACFSSRSSDWAATVQRMLQAQRLPEDSPGCVFPVAGGAIGWTQPAGRRSPLPALYRSRCGSLLAVTGLPIDISGASIERRLGAAVEAGGEEVTRELKQLDGVFAALFWDAPAGTLHVVTDILGLQPLYSFRQPGLLLLSAGQRGLTASGLLKVESDPAGWGAFIDLGNVLGETTQLKGIRRVDPGAVWTFDPRQDRLERTPYWHWPERDPGLKHAGLDTGDLLSVLDREIQAYLGHCPETTVLLSGGGDSRFLTAMLLRNGVRPAALTVKHSDELLGADHRFAAQVGRRHCSEFLALTPPRDFFSTPDYLDYLEATEAGAQSLYLFIAAVGALIGEHRPAVWDGLLPGITVTGYFRRARTPAELLEKVCAPRNSQRWRGACMVFEKGLADGMYGESQAALRQEAARYPSDMNGVNQFWVRNRTRVRTGANPCRVYARRSLAYTPCVSKEFWSMIMPLPCEEREHH
ncbi:MAG: hypothetical protein IT158_31320, partial [Bryobacterales bacterium]|nr:hypothetical protein [Bryobacterales bacterium]